MILRAVTHRFPGRDGFRLGPLDLEGPDDRPWLVLGPAGSGKTTLLRILGGSLRPGEGRIEGLDPGDAAYLPQLPERALAGRNLAEDLCGEIRPSASRRARLREALGRAGLEGIPLSRRSRELSSGERRRLLLALLFLSGRRHWALDEPDAGLDGAGLRRLAGLLATRPEAGRLWIASHRIPPFVPLRPWTVVLRGGSALAAGEPEQVLRRAEVRACLALHERPPARVKRVLAGAETAESSLQGTPPATGTLAQLFSLLEDTTELA